jgi:hypothetical protein
MIKKFSNGDMPTVSLDTDKWRDIMLPLLRHGNHSYRFEGNANVGIEQLSKKMVMPLLLYALAEMYDLLKTSLPNENIAKDLIAIGDDLSVVDDFGILTPTYNQAKFIGAYEKEVIAWLPLAIKKYVQPNRAKIKDFISGNI